MNKYRTLYKALPFCIEDKENQGILEKENIYKTYTYNSNFANIALADDNEEFFKAKQKQVINLLYDEECKSLYLANQKNGIQVAFNPMSSTLYVDTQAKELYIFANDKDYIDCDTIYKQIKQELNLQESLEELQSYKPSLFFYSQLLTGGTESPLPLSAYFFGELDSKSSIGLDESVPIYYFSPKDESSGLGKLNVFYKNNTLYLLNYSILENSLNIKLECLSKQSLEYQDSILKTKKQQEHITLNASQSIATLNALLENQKVECIHGGVVQLKSNLGKSIQDKNIPFILETIKRQVA